MSKAKDYFIMADQYLETSKLLLKTMINSGNSTIGFGLSEIEAETNMKNNSVKSDSTLFLPALFNCYQGVELFIKGLLYLNNNEFKNTHEISNMINGLKNVYGEKHNVYISFYNFYKYQLKIIEKFKNSNNITTMKELYEALRYPENNDRNKSYCYIDLRYNGDYGIEMFSKLLEKIDKLKDVVLSEFNNFK